MTSICIASNPECFGICCDDVEASALPLVTQSGAVAPANAIDGKVVALYFSANWCPYCRQFTPQLRAFYETLKANGENFEVVFISADRSMHDFETYFRYDHGDWLAVQYGSSMAAGLISYYQFRSWPTLLVIDAKGAVALPKDQGLGEVRAASSEYDVLWTYSKWKQLGL